MVDVPLSYHDLADVQKREYFDPTCSISLQNFEALIAETHIKVQIICQLEIDGSRCNNKHNNGWLARRKDGKEGFIGCDCGNKYLHASETFGREKNRLQRELRIAGHISALKNLLADKDTLLSRWGVAHQRLLATRGIMRQLEKDLPAEVVDELRDMAKRRSRTIYVEVKRIEIEKDAQGKEKERVYWDRRDVGSVAGLESWDPGPALYLFKKLEEIKAAIWAAKTELGQKESAYRNWRETLEELPHCEEVLDTYERATKDFFTAENCALLCHLVRGHDAQMEIARVALRRGETSPSNTSVRAFVNQAQANVRKRYGGRDFRSAY